MTRVEVLTLSLPSCAIPPFRYPNLPDQSSLCSPEALAPTRNADRLPQAHPNLLLASLAPVLGAEGRVVLAPKLSRRQEGRD